MQRLLNIAVGVIGAFVARLVLNLLGVDANSGGYWLTVSLSANPEVSRGESYRGLPRPTIRLVI